MIKVLKSIILVLVLAIMFGCQTKSNRVERSYLGYYSKNLTWDDGSKIYYDNNSFVYKDDNQSHTFDGVRHNYGAELVGIRNGEKLVVKEVKIFYNNKSRSFKVDRPVVSFGSSKRNGYGDVIRTGGMSYFPAGYFDDMLADVGKYRSIIVGTYRHKSGATLVLNANGEGVGPANEKILLSNRFGTSDLVILTEGGNLPILSFNANTLVIGNKSDKIVLNKISK